MFKRRRGGPQSMVILPGGGGLKFVQPRFKGQRKSVKPQTGKRRTERAEIKVKQSISVKEIEGNALMEQLRKIVDALIAGVSAQSAGDTEVSLTISAHLTKKKITQQIPDSVEEVVKGLENALSEHLKKRIKLSEELGRNIAKARNEISTVASENESKKKKTKNEEADTEKPDESSSKKKHKHKKNQSVTEEDLTKGLHAILDDHLAKRQGEQEQSTKKKSKKRNKSESEDTQNQNDDSVDVSEKKKKKKNKHENENN